MLGLKTYYILDNYLTVEGLIPNEVLGLTWLPGLKIASDGIVLLDVGEYYY